MALGACKELITKDETTSQSCSHVVSAGDGKATQPEYQATASTGSSGQAGALQFVCVWRAESSGAMTLEASESSLQNIAVRSQIIDDRMILIMIIVVALAVAVVATAAAVVVEMTILRTEVINNNYETKSRAIRLGSRSVQA